jgi:hypothetical protein
LPALFQGLELDMLLGWAGVERRDLGGARRGVARLGEDFLDLVAALRDQLQHPIGHADDLRVIRTRRPRGLGRFRLAEPASL